MITLIRLEVFKLIRRLRSYLGFGALLAMAGLVVLALALGGDVTFGPSIPQGFGMIGSYQNGGFVAWMLLMMATRFLLPLFACVVVGDMISGEAADGTLRVVLSRPVGRGKLFAGKFVVSALYVLKLTFFLGIAAYGIGSIFLGHGALVAFDEGNSTAGPGVYVYNELEGIVRLLAAYAFAALGVLSVATIAFFISVLVSNSLGAIGGAMMTFIIFEIVGAISYFKPIHPFLFTTHMHSMGGLFATPIPWAEIGKSIGVLAVYVLTFFIAGLVIFRRRDVLS